jgi:AcrR family transcriptional regulator
MEGEDGTDERPRRTGKLRARVGGRSERVVRDVMDATVRELARVGYAALRVEDVAASAGVNKTTVYRRWPTKADLVTATLRAAALSEDDLPDTGDLRADLLALMRHQAAIISTPEGRAVTRMMLVERDDPDVLAVVRALREEKVSRWIAVIGRAVARGELPEGTDPRLIGEVLMGTVVTKLRWNDRVTDDYLRAVLDLVVRGAAHGGAILRT